MKRKILIIILIILGLALMSFGVYKVAFSKNSEIYEDATIEYDAEATFMEKGSNKSYVEFKYTNKSEKTAIIKNAKVSVYKDGSNDSIYDEKIEVNKTVESGKTITLKFKEINKSLEELLDYYPEVTIE